MEFDEKNVEEAIIKNEKERKEEKKTKGKILKIILIVVISLIVGIVGGFYILSGINKGVKQNSFMYDVLNKSGLLLSSNEIDNNTTSATDANYDTATPVDSDVFNNMTFIQEKNGIKYYYYKTSDGDNLYYYTNDYSEDIFRYYASDSDGYFMDQTYMDYMFEKPKYVTVPDMSSYNFDDIKDGIDGSYFEGLKINFIVIKVPNEKYKDKEIYYQSIKSGEKLVEWGTITIIVNANE